MGTKVRYIIQELIGSEWTLAAARDDLTAILHVWEQWYLPQVAASAIAMYDEERRAAETHIPIQARVRMMGAMPRTFRIARMTPNALTIIDPDEHSQRHRIRMRKARNGIAA